MKKNNKKSVEILEGVNGPLKGENINGLVIRRNGVIFFKKIVVKKRKSKGK